MSRGHWQKSLSSQFYKHREKNNVSASENSKTSFPKRLGWKDIAGVWWPPICLSRTVQRTFHWFCMGSEKSNFFSINMSSFFLIRLSGWCIWKGCSEDSRDFSKAMELWNRNVYTDLTGKWQNLETKQIKSHVFSYVSDINCNLCFISFINSDIFYDTLESIATFKLP